MPESLTVFYRVVTSEIKTCSVLEGSCLCKSEQGESSLKYTLKAKNLQRIKDNKACGNIFTSTFLRIMHRRKYLPNKSKIMSMMGHSEQEVRISTLLLMTEFWIIPLLCCLLNNSFFSTLLNVAPVSRNFCTLVNKTVLILCAILSDILLFLIYSLWVCFIGGSGEIC